MFRGLPQRTKSIVKVLLVCVVTSTLISAIKITYGLTTDSLAFLADGIHSILDSAATIQGMVFVILAAQPPDETHPYGHKKFETISAIFLAMLLLLAAIEVGEAAYNRLSNPEINPQYSHWGLVILFVTMIANLSIAFMEARAAKRLGSPFLASDSLHNRSDFVITIGVFISLICLKFGVPKLDAIVSMAIALYLAYLSIRVVFINLNPLVDHRVLDPSRVENIVATVSEVTKCHTIRSRGEKGHYFLDLSLHLPPKMTLAEAHNIADEVEIRLKKTFPGLADVIIHTEPHGHKSEESA